MLKLIVVGMGGFLGAISRYVIGGWIHRYVDKPWFPLGTLFVNMVGCLLIGYLYGLVINRNLFSPELRLFMIVGFLGGLTTFSSFGYETFSLAQDGLFNKAFLNIALQLMGGLTAVWFGNVLSRL